MRLLLILSLLFSLQAHANLSVEEIKSLAFDTPVTKPYFYKLSYKGKTSYLLGTYHWGVSLDEFPQAIREKLDVAPTVALELPSSDQKFRQSEFCLSRLEFCLLSIKPNPMRSKLKKDRRKALRPFLNENFLKQVHPYLEVTHAYMAWPDLVTKGGSLDFEIESQSRHFGHRIVALEDRYIRSQADAYAASQGDKPIKNPILYDLAKKADMGNYTWFEEQANEISDYKNGQYEHNSDTWTSVGFRNRAWMPKIIELLEQGESFIAVGVSHLHGDTGLLNYLKKNNVQIEHYGQ